MNGEAGLVSTHLQKEKKMSYKHFLVDVEQEEAEEHQKALQGEVFRLVSFTRTISKLHPKNTDGGPLVKGFGRFRVQGAHLEAQTMQVLTLFYGSCL